MNEEELKKQVAALQEGHKFLMAELLRLRTYQIAVEQVIAVRLADLLGIDSRVLQDEMDERGRIVHDSALTQIEDKNPHIASLLDHRDEEELPDGGSSGPPP